MLHRKCAVVVLLSIEARTERYTQTKRIEDLLTDFIANGVRHFQLVDTLILKW